MTPLAHVQVPSWGDNRVPVLVIDGPRWTVQGPRTALYRDGRRTLDVSKLNLLHLVPAHVDLEVRQGRASRLVEAHAPGSEALEDRRLRLIRASENGLHVVAAVGGDAREVA